MCFTALLTQASQGTKHFRTVNLIPAAQLAGAVAEMERLLPIDAGNIQTL
jgi:hypothetical protein